MEEITTDILSTLYNVTGYVDATNPLNCRQVSKAPLISLVLNAVTFFTQTIKAVRLIICVFILHMKKAKVKRH